MVEALALCVFAALLIYAACSDVASLTIPNWVSLAMAGLFVPAAMLAGAPLYQIGLHLLFGLGVLVVGFFLFQANIIGGGDAKLLAAATVWTGFPAFAPFVFWTALAGGVMALALLAARTFIKQAETNPSFVNRLLKHKGGIPYGVAIMAGGLMAIPALPFMTSPLTLP
ncbi:MAG TPA: prepilin peptidase [Vitreimonas sp.]|uniref:A24 family peptidase n=1 Tax=Vitreimonas sp. TaxID=3069702 RepID=UPI002D6C905C|nr:prepilin peptidase [Vitreimonas sp.]HYD86601.1 prepilin peptidase [Vitreimonas sp.]